MLNEALKKVGLSKAGLAKILDVDRKTISRMGDEITPEVEAVLAMYEPTDNVPVELPMEERRKEPEEYSMDDIKALCLRRGGYEALSYKGHVKLLGEYRETDYQIACSLGLKVHELNKMIEWYAKNYRTHYKAA